MIDHDGLRDLLEATARVDARAESDADLLGTAVALEAIRGRLDAAQAQVLAELDARGTTDRDLGLHTGAWLAREAHLPIGAARARVRVAVKLRTTLPRTVTALADGRVSWAHAATLAAAANPRIAADIAALEGELLDASVGTTFERWRAEVAARAELLDQDGGHDPNRDVNRNRLSVSRTFGGATHLSGLLTAEHGAVAAATIDAHADRLFHRYRADHERHPEIPIPTRATLRALAFAEICRLAAARTTPSHSAGPQPTAPGGSADAGDRPGGSDGHVAPNGPDGGPGGPADPAASSGRARVPADGILPRPEVLLVLHADRPGQLCTDDGHPLPGGLTNPLLADPDLYAVVVNSLGEPVNLGRRVRLATTTQRRAIRARDGGCVFPGCDAPLEHCDIHHVTSWQHGGPTDLNTLAALCRHHHGVTHRLHWTMRATDDGWYWWQTPTGRTYWSQRHGRQHPGPAPPPILKPKPAGPLRRRTPRPDVGTDSGPDAN